VLEPWAQPLGAFAILRFGEKKCCSWETFDLQNCEIGASHFGLRAMGALVDENPEMPISKITEVKSTTLFFSQTDDPYLILCLTFDLRPLPWR
jgi:hypothetical protein